MQLQLPELALAYCDRVYEAGLHQVSKSSSNIYLTLLQIYLNPQKTTKDFEQRNINPILPQNVANQKSGSAKTKASRVARKVAEIEWADDIRISPSGTDSGRSDGDGDEISGEGGPIMSNEALDLLSQRWDRINGAQALRLLPRDTKLQVLIAINNSCATFQDS